MTNATKPASFFVTGGTLPPDASSYVERQADRDLLAALLAGHYCYVLNSRQMGKSSISVRAISRLREQGVRTAFVDLTRIGAQNVTAEQWYAGLLAETGRAVNLRDRFLAHWKQHIDLPPVQRYFTAIREVAIAEVESPLVIFVDEIDAVRSLSFSADEFFAAVRACHNARTEDDGYKRLTFCLVGSATPADLISDTRMSPFNIGKRIELRDFSPVEAAPLASGLGEDGRALLDRVLYWTNGHPYLTQRLCSALAASSTSNGRQPSSVDTLCREMFLTHTARESDDNLSFVRSRLLRSEADLASLLFLYRKMRSAGVPDDETDPLIGILKLSGTARVEGGRLRIRNRIYEEVFDRDWVEKHMPDAELRRQRAAYRKGLFRAATASVVIIGVVSGLALSAVRNARDARNSAAAAKSSAAVARKNEERAKEEATRANLLVYAADLNLAEQSYENGEFDRVAALLQDTKESPDRGFEWNFLYRAIHAEKWQKRFGENPVLASFTPDGRHVLVTTWADGAQATAVVLDAATGAELFRPSGSMHNAQFTSDGRMLLTCDGYAQWSAPTKAYPGKVSIWDVSSGIKLTDYPEKHAFCELSKHGDLVLSSTPDAKDSDPPFLNPYNSIQVLDARTGKTLYRLPGKWHAFFSWDGALIVASGKSRTCTFDARTGRLIGSISGNYFAGPPFGSEVALSKPFGVVAAASQWMDIYDTCTWRRLLHIPVGKDDYGSILARTHRAYVVNAAGSSATLRVFDARSGKPFWTYTAPVRPGELLRGISDAEDRFFVARGHTEAAVLDGSTGRELRRFSSADDGLVASADGKLLLGTDNHGRIRMYDGRASSNVWEYDREDAAEATMLPDNRRILYSVKVGDKYVDRIVDTGSDAPVIRFPDHQYTTVLPHKNLIVRYGRRPLNMAPYTGPDQHSYPMMVCDLRTGKKIRMIGSFVGAYPNFSPDGESMVFCETGKGMHIVDLETWTDRILARTTRRLGYTTFTADGHRLVTSVNEGGAPTWPYSGSRITLWCIDRATGSTLWQQEVKKGWILHGVGGKYIVLSKQPTSGRTDNTDHTVLDISTGKELKTLTNCAIQGGVDRLLIRRETVDGFTPIEEYDVETGKSRPLLRMPGIQWGYSISPDVTRLYMSGPTGKTEVWSLRSGRQLMTLPVESNRILNWGMSADGLHFTGLVSERGKNVIKVLNGSPPVIDSEPAPAVNRAASAFPAGTTR